MNDLLQNYLIDTQYPDISGIEHLQMLRNRSKLAELEANLTSDEPQELVAADLVFHAKKFFAELSRFIELADERRRLGISREQWWWYLDIIAQLPSDVIKEPATQRVPQLQVA